MSRSSRVNFPRFQEEQGGDDVYGPDLIHRTTQRRWISDVAVQIHDRAAKTQSIFNVSKIDTARTLNWWGVYHRTKSRSTSMVEGPAAFMPRSKNVLLWMTHSRHSYLWDHQAIDGRCTELVLTRFTKADQGNQPNSDTTRELAALMIDGYYPERQRLVLNGPDGWHEPTDAETDIAQSMLYAMSRISFREIVMERRTRQMSEDMGGLTLERLI